MDPITQASLGAATAAAVAYNYPGSVRKALFIGAIAGASPDLDVLIHSDADPLLTLEYHRNFSHSIASAPIIGFVIALILKTLFYRKNGDIKEIGMYSILGVLTHGLLDACTGYGTMLYLPFSQSRVSWNIISIIDPLFTIPLLIMIALAFKKKKQLFARIGVLLCLCYLMLGCLQRERAKNSLMALAEKRGHTPTEITTRPSIANNVLWRMIYRHQDKYFVDAISLLPWSDPKIYEGGPVKAFTASDEYSIYGNDTRLANDISRFKFFSENYLYQYKGPPKLIGDLRYSMLPNSTVPLWGIHIKQDNAIEFINHRERKKGDFKQLLRMICGR